MTATIKRYGLVSGQTFSWIDEVPNGRYVKYYDHVEEVTAVQERVAELEAALEAAERESRANAAEYELADLRERVLLCQRRYAAGCSRESMAEALNEAVQTLVLVSKAEQSELAALRGRVERAIAVIERDSTVHNPNMKRDALEALRG